MKGKTAYVVLFLALIAAVFTLDYILRHDTGTESEPHPFLVGFKPDRVAAVELHSSTGSLRLERKEKDWTVRKGEEPAVAADSAKVQKFLESLEDLDVGSPVSRNPEHQAEFALGPEATSIKIYDPSGASLSSFSVGRVTSAFTGEYVRLEGRNEVYATSSLVDLSDDVGSWKVKR